MTWFLIKFGIRIVVFGAVFAVVAYRSKRVSVEPKWAIPLVGLVFAGLNTALYWVLSLMVSVASLWTLSLAAPLIVNALLLYGTNRVVKYLKIEGLAMMFWMSLYLTAAHGALWLVLDKIL